MSRRFTLHSEVSSISEEEDSFNLAVIGDSSEGKLTLICRLIKHWTEQSSKSHKKSKKRGNAPADLGIKGRSLTVDIVDTSTTKSCTFPQGLPSFDVYVLVYSLVCDGSFESVVAARDQILQQEGPSVPNVFVANKTDIVGSVDKTERMSRDLNISCEWEHGHVEISAEKDLSVIQFLVYLALVKSNLLVVSAS
ncbi:ras-like protein family member 10B [Haliotis rufescens]|uniref:ras-like protein family member 10B n=1 Tax=Haliotis rufescens TaxID=6454 RepID=UPI00201E8D6F|nr:ras-like protein family member 10B [Haliotis rufescens]